MIPRYVAFLGGINVGGHRVAMDRLRAEFEGLGLTDVSTFITSGNVLFDSDDDRAGLERRLESHLATQLGFPVPTFVRSAEAVVEIAAFEPFGTLADGETHLAGFLRDAPSAIARHATEALSNEQDTFVVRGTELHWRIRGNVLSSSIKANVLAKAILQPMTTRNLKSLRKLAVRLKG